MISDRRRLSEVGRFVAGCAFPPAMQLKQGLLYPFAKVGDISIAVEACGGLLGTARSTVSEEDLVSLGMDPLPVGSTVFAKIGEAIRVNNRAITARECLIDNNVMAFVPDEMKITSRYAYQFFRTLDLYAFADKTTVPSIRKSRLELIEIPLPPLPEQRRIAAILDHADALRAKRRTAIAKLDSLTQSIFLDMFGDPVRNTLQLKTSTLGELGDWQSGGTPPRAETRYFGGDIPWFSSGELEGPFVNRSNENVTRDAITETSAKLVSPNSLMLGMYDTAALKASIAEVSCSCNQAIAFSLLNPQKAEVLFVYFVILLGREHFRRLQRGVRQKNLNLEMIRAIEFPLPSIAAQREFVEHYKQILNLKSAIEKSGDIEAELIVSLHHRAFLGTL